MKYANMFFVCKDQEIYKCDKGGNWYVFRHGGWNHVTGCCSGDSKPEWISSEHRTLASARKVALLSWLKEFEEFRIECIPWHFNAKSIKIPKNPYYMEGDENAPFWSESFLYSLVGKEDARSILARLRRLDDIARAYK